MTPPSVTASPAIGIALATQAPPTVVVRQTTPTPRPAPTVTPSPTPIVYQVAAGDTLLGIAIDQGVTVEEILALNPDVEPQLLQIGQPLILPPPPVDIGVGSVADTAVSADVVVSQVQTYRTPLGGVWLLGEVVNEGAALVDGLQVTLTLPDMAGAAEVTAVAWVMAPLLAPGQRAPFAALVANPPQEMGDPLVAVTGGTAVVDLGTRYLDLQVTETEMVVADGRAQLTGQVENVGQEAAEAVTVVATLVDAQGRISGVQQIVLPGTVLPGERGPFALTAVVPGLPPADYQMLVFARRAAP